MKILSLQHPRIRTIPLRANTRKHNKDCTAKLSLSNEKSSDAFYGVIFPISCIFFAEQYLATICPVSLECLGQFYSWWGFSGDRAGYESDTVSKRSGPQIFTRISV